MIAGSSPLSPDEEKAALAELVAARNDVADGATGAKERHRRVVGLLVWRNVGLVVSIASRRQGQGLALEDLVQEGVIGLLRALELFDPTRGLRLSTYATWWIRRAVARAVENQGRTIRQPIHVGNARRAIGPARRRAFATTGRDSTLDELASATGLRPATVAAVVAAPGEPRSLDAPIAEGGASLLECLASDAAGPEAILLARERASEARRLLAGLSERDRQVLAYRFGVGPEKKSRRVTVTRAP